MMRPLCALLSLCLPSITLGFVAPSSSNHHATITAITPKSQLLASKNDEATAAAAGTIMDRRSVMERGATAAVSAVSASFLLGGGSNAAMAAEYDDSVKKRILITGSNSGIGLDAAERMAVRGHEIILACRTLSKAKAAAEKIKNNIVLNSEDAVDANILLKSLKLTPMECDLASLSSIDTFVKQLDTSKPLDIACYNAGLARNTEAKDVARTADGFELTVGTNHLGHFYLHNQLFPLLNKESGRIVVTASGVHDPDSPGGAQGVPATLGQLEGFEDAVSKGTKQFDMVDGSEFNADKAYKDSKLANVYFTRELQRRLTAAGSKVQVNCFNPGLIVGTGLFRDQNQVFTKVFDIAATNLLKVGESTHWGGGALEYMALSDKVGEGRGGLFYSSAPGSSKFGDDAFGKQFDKAIVSREAKASDEDGRAKQFWELSETLVGISA